MAAISLAKREKPKKTVKSGTESHRKHRFESFNQRVAKLKIDPIRQNRRLDVGLDDSSHAASYFRPDLERWRNLNLSESFTAFVREVAPFCDSLPQILHFQRDIATSLTMYIQKRDELSLEPLLSLLASFAHDLGPRFEPYFADFVGLVASVASTHQHVEVIDWSFSCLAWLFKYLSRLLVPDLRPLFYIMAPLLGKSPQKLHTTRFAAEAMAFLMRKAALSYQKNGGPLVNIIDCIWKDVCSETKNQLYCQGLMSLLVDAIKGIDRGLHSAGADVFESLLNRLDLDDGPVGGMASIIEGVTTALIHHTDQLTFNPIMLTILRHIHHKAESNHSDGRISRGNHQGIYSRLLMVAVGVRKGSRVQDWTSVIHAHLVLLETSSPDSVNGLSNTDYEAAAVILQLTPFDIILPNVRRYMELLTNKEQPEQFLRFCSNLCILDRERFDELIYSYFLRFINANWKDLRSQICKSLPLISPVKKVPCANPWQKEIVETFERARDQGGDDLIHACSMYLGIFEHLSLELPTQHQITHILCKMIDEGLQTPDESDARTRFVFGEAFKYYAQSQPINKSNVWLSMYGRAAQYRTVVPYLKAVLYSINTLDVSEDHSGLDSLVASVMQNLRTSSHQLRLLSLQIIQSLLIKLENPKVHILNIMLALENCPLDIQSARSASMYARKISAEYVTVASHPWLREAVSFFCFGMLTFKLASLWNDAVEILKQVCSTSSHGEELISDLAFEWLDEPVCSSKWDSPGVEVSKQPSLNAFQCSNLIKTDEIFQAAIQSDDIRAQLRGKFDTAHENRLTYVSDSPAIALRVLAGIPWIAEKKSRRLVPIFLKWASNVTDNEFLSTDSDSSKVTDLNYKDRRSMLHLFSLFTNPKVLYRSSDVFEALKNLLANGKSEIQRAALKAVLTWKIPAIDQYQNHLMNILDDANFRDEISTFVQLDEEDSCIEGEHRRLLMPILLRLLYGRLIAGIGHGKRAQSITRRAVLEALARFGQTDCQEFLAIALGPLQRVAEGGNLMEMISLNLVTPRRQMGVMNMLRDMLELLPNKLKNLVSSLTAVVLFCMVKAQRELSQAVQSEVSVESLQRTIRQVGMQCLCLLFRQFDGTIFEPYMSIIFEEILYPRLGSFPIDTAHSISGMLQVFSTWASKYDTAQFLTCRGPEVMTSIIGCLEIPSAKEDVKIFVLDEILRKLAQRSHQTQSVDAKDSDDRGSFQQLLEPTVISLLGQLGRLLANDPTKDLQNSATDLLLELAPMLRRSDQTESLLEVSVFLLEQPSNRVSPKVKGRLLQIVRHFVPLYTRELSSSILDRLYSTTSLLFGYFKDRENRLFLSQVLSVLAKIDQEVQEAARLCDSLNSFSAHQIDEPDFEKRLAAFNEINERRFKTFTAKQWRPIVFNMLFHIQDNEELAIRSNASLVLRRFVETNTVCLIDKASTSFDILSQILLPALRSGVSNSSELVRAEYLAVTAHLIRVNPEWDEVRDMVGLLVGDDEEASFFNNVLHIQQHRRLRALRRLAVEARQGQLSSTNVARFFLPLIEHFVFDKAEDENAHNLSAETLATIGALVPRLKWSQFRAVFRRFTGYLRSKPELEKTIIKLLGVVVSSLCEVVEASKQRLGRNDSTEAVDETDNVLSHTLPKDDKFREDLLDNFIPPLTNYLHQKDDSTVSLRVPIAISSVKLLKLLSYEQIRERLPPVLTDVCHILRSRSQDSRDLTRKTLVDISTLIGPAYFGFVLKELRGALARGYQLHVLSYTMHSILAATSSVFSPGDLDYCLAQIVSVILDDIFGVTGQEKDAEEYISSMREVKSSKSFDSMELVASKTTIENLTYLVRPLQALMGERVDSKKAQKIDELLRRIGAGLIRNQAFQSRKVLIFCHEVIRETYKQSHSQAEDHARIDHDKKHRLINHREVDQPISRRSRLSSDYKLIRFGLDILRSVLHKHEVLRTPSNIAGFMPILGDALVDPNEEVQMSGIRLLTTIIKVPLKEIDGNAGIYVAECAKIIKGSASMNAELAQAALKLISAVLRERKSAEVRETDIAYLLKRLVPDLQEPDRQGVAFNFLRAVMARKIVITEMYEVLDVVASIMITNQSRGARDLARGVYFQFLMDYPQGKRRFEKQKAFLVENLNFKHPEGRQSVMEVIHLLFLKLSDDMLQDILGTFFGPLVLIIANDESSPCKEMAALLLKTCFARANAEQTGGFLRLLRKWLSERDDLLRARVALQIYCIFFDVGGSGDRKEAEMLQPELSHILQKGLLHAVDAGWELLYFALQTASKILRKFPDIGLGQSSTWPSICECLRFHHTWVKLSSAKLLGTFLNDFTQTTADQEEIKFPLKGSNGLELQSQDALEITRASLGCLRIPNVSEDLAGQSARNLVFLGQVMGRSSFGLDEIARLNLLKADEAADDEFVTGPYESETRTGLEYLFQRASGITRRGPLTTRAPSLVPVKAALQVLGALCHHLPISAISSSVGTILLPLHNLTDSSIPAPFSTDEEFNSGYRSLISNASEIMALLQKKLGTTDYIAQLTKVGESIKARREDRRIKRRIEAVADPEKTGRLKKRKGEKKKAKRKEKSGDYRSQRRGW